MPLPLFVHTPMCQDRLMCRECRQKDPMYRQGWSGKYQMPPGWPECPFGVEWNTEGGTRPVEPHLLGMAVDHPDTPEAIEIMEKVKARAATVRETCLHCPEGFFYGLSEDGLVVDCGAGFACGCGGMDTDNPEPVRGSVHLGSGMCKRGHWRGK